jgi:hypothetical protein
MSHFRVGTVVYEFNARTAQASGRPIAMCANVHVAQRIVDSLNGKRARS